MCRLDEEEVARAGVDPGRHAELHPTDRAHRVARRLDEPLHRGGRRRRSHLVRRALEEQQQRVAAELEHVATEPLRDPDQPLEAAADDEDQLLGADAALARRAAPTGS